MSRPRRLKPLQVLSLQMWQLIFDELRDIPDILNFWYATNRQISRETLSTKCTHSLLTRISSEVVLYDHYARVKEFVSLDTLAQVNTRLQRNSKRKQERRARFFKQNPSLRHYITSSDSESSSHSELDEADDEREEEEEDYSESDFSCASSSDGMSSSSSSSSSSEDERH